MKEKQKGETEVHKAQPPNEYKLACVEYAFVLTEMITFQSFATGLYPR